MKPETLALIMATAMSALRTVRAAHQEDKSLSSRMPGSWLRLLKVVKDFDRDFGNVISKE